MKSLLRLACLAALLPLPAYATEPTSVDVYRELIRHRTADLGVDKALDYDTREYVSRFLVNPDSPYSDLRADPPITNEVWWYDFVDELAIDAPDKSGAALAMLQWQGGFTKARFKELGTHEDPDTAAGNVDVVVDDLSARSYARYGARGKSNTLRSPNAAANAIKARVDPDIYLKAWDLNGALTTVAAGHAVALQILREDALSHSPETHEARGIKKDVLTRYLRQDHPERISESDLAYLADILRYALSDQSVKRDANGNVQLPAAYRVARVAAAYADAGGYFNSEGYCKGTEVNEKAPSGAKAFDDNTPLCFVAATDRAVQSWFRRQMRHEEASVRSAHNSPDEAERRVQFWFSAVLTLVDIAGFVEFAEAGLVDELSAEGALTEEEAAFAEERASQLTCRIRQ
jgi:hypothetical protein